MPRTETMALEQVAAAERSRARDCVTRSAVYLHPGQVFVSPDPAVVTTILGSCVAVCVFDPVLRVGGTNHYLLPHWVGTACPRPASGTWPSAA